MRQVTLRGIPEALRRNVEQRARRDRTSLNKAFLALLEESVGAGARPGKRPVVHSDLDEFCGLWSRPEAEEFDTRLRSQRTVDAELWKRTG